MRRVLVASVLLALVPAMGGCAVWGPEGGPGGSGLKAPAPDVSPPVDAVVGVDGVQRVEITAGDDLRFSPSVVRAHPGVIEFVFRNTGTTPHEARIEVSPSAPPSADTGNLNGGQSATVRVTVTQPGHYPFPCLYHVSSGMTGTLDVS